MDYTRTNYLFGQLHHCLFDRLSDDELASNDAVTAYMNNEGKERIWCALVSHQIPYDEQSLYFMDEVQSNFFMCYDNRATQLATWLRSKVDRLLFEYNRFVDKIARLWGVPQNVVLAWVDVEPNWFISDIKKGTARSSTGEPYDTEHPQYVFADYVGLVIAAVRQTVSYCQDYIFTYGLQAAPTSIDQEPKPTEVGVKRSNKKTPQLTTKQQMILLDMLGFRNAPILANLDNIRKASILANLLNRSEQEIRGMLTYWHGDAPKQDYDCNNPDDQDRVIDFLLNNGVPI